MEKYNMVIAYNNMHIDITLPTNSHLADECNFYVFRHCNMDFDCMYYNVYADNVIRLTPKFYGQI